MQRFIDSVAATAVLALLCAPAFAHAPGSPEPATPPEPPTPRAAPAPSAVPQPPEPPEPPCPKIAVNGVHLNGEARGFLGVEPTRLSPELRAHFGLPADRGVLVGEIVDGSSAESAGLRVGDLVTRVDGEEIDDPWGLTAAIASRQGGDSVEIEVWRDGSTRTTTAVLDHRERCAFDLGQVLPLEALRGLEALGDIDLDFDFDFEQLGLDEAELERIAEQSLAAASVAIEEALGALDEIDWEAQMQHFEELQEMELEEVEQRMEQIHERMRELERDLEHETRREIERERHEMERDRAEVERDRAEIERHRAERERDLADARRDLEEELAELAAERSHDRFE